MPDYSIIQKLCDALHVTLPELMDGEDAAENSVHVYDNEQILGIASGAMSKTTGGTDVQDFFSGILMVCPSQKFWQASGPPERSS